MLVDAVAIGEIATLQIDKKCCALGRKMLVKWLFYESKYLSAFTQNHLQSDIVQRTKRIILSYFIYFSY